MPEGHSAAISDVAPHVYVVGAVMSVAFIVTGILYFESAPSHLVTGGFVASVFLWVYIRDRKLRRGDEPARDVRPHLVALGAVWTVAYVAVSVLTGSIVPLGVAAFLVLTLGALYVAVGRHFD